MVWMFGFIKSFSGSELCSSSLDDGRLYDDDCCYGKGFRCPTTYWQESKEIIDLTAIVQLFLKAWTLDGQHSKGSEFQPGMRDSQTLLWRSPSGFPNINYYYGGALACVTLAETAPWRVPTEVSDSHRIAVVGLKFLKNIGLTLK